MVEQAEIESRAASLRVWYDAHRFKCSVFEQRLLHHLEKSLLNAGITDFQLASRTKTVDSYVAKACKEVATGGFKYRDPQLEIKDAVGLRVLVPLSTDVAPVAGVLKRAYEIDQEERRGDEEAHLDIPGYRSLHLTVRLRDVDRSDIEFKDFSDMVAEVQVRTTLQHAWASLQHDVMYKTERPPSPGIRRRLVALAGLLELADREFVQVRQTHGEIRDEVEPAAVAGAERLTAAGLRHIAENLFGEEDPAAQDWFIQLAQVCGQLGVTTADALSAALGDWAARAPEVATTVRMGRPWVNTAYLLDVLLRLSMRDEYFAKRPPYTEDEPMGPEDLATCQRKFEEELDDLERALVDA